MIQDAPAELPEVVVTAARLPPAAGEAAFSVTRLDRSDLHGEARLDEALRQVPAVSLFRRNTSLSANPTTQGVSLRAVAPSGAGRALVTLDGVPLNDPFGGWVIWSQVTPEALDGLSLVRGAGAGPYGAGALTGVIALQDGDGGVADLSVGARGGARAAAAVGGGRDGMRLTLSGLREVSDGFVPVRGARAGAADTPMDLDVWSLAARADKSLGAATASLRLAAFEEDRGSGLAGARATARGDVASLTLARSPNRDTLGWRLQVWRRESDLTNSSVVVSADRSTATPSAIQDRTPAVGWGLNAAIRRGGALEWEFGLDARTAEGETRERFRFMGGQFTRGRVAGGETTVAGVYGEAAWRAGAWLVAGGLRADHWENADGRRLETDLASGSPTLDERDAGRSGQVASARLALRRELARGWSARTAAYSSFRPATLNELHRPFRVGSDLTEANAGLRPERLKGVEAGLAWSDDAATMTATVFVNRIEEAVVNVTIGSGPGTFPRAGFVPAGGVLRQRMNAGTIEAVGLELAGERRWERLRLSAAASATDARMNGGDAAPQLTGLRPAQAPIWSAVVAADWITTDRLTLSLDARWESRRFEDDLNSRALEAGLTLDARAEWRVVERVGLWLALDNLADARIPVSETANGVEGFGPPRSVRAGLRLTF